MLFLTQVLNDRIFRREGADVHVDVPISISQVKATCPHICECSTPDVSMTLTKQNISSSTLWVELIGFTLIHNNPILTKMMQ